MYAVTGPQWTHGIGNSTDTTTSYTRVCVSVWVHRHTFRLTATELTATEKSPATGHVDHVMLSRRSHILAVPLGMLFTGAHPTQTNKLCPGGPAFGHPKFLGVQNALTIQTCKFFQVSHHVKLDVPRSKIRRAAKRNGQGPDLAKASSADCTGERERANKYTHRSNGNPRYG